MLFDCIYRSVEFDDFFYMFDDFFIDPSDICIEFFNSFNSFVVLRDFDDFFLNLNFSNVFLNHFINILWLGRLLNYFFNYLWLLLDNLTYHLRLLDHLNLSISIRCTLYVRCCHWSLLYIR